MTYIMQFATNIVQTVKLLKFFVRFHKILRIFFDKLSVSGGLRPQALYGAPLMDPAGGLPSPRRLCVCPY